MITTDIVNYELRKQKFFASESGHYQWAYI